MVRVVGIAMAYYVQVRCNLRSLFNFSRGYTLVTQTNAYPLLKPCSAWTVGGNVSRKGHIVSACNYQTCAALCARDGSGARVTKGSKSKQEHRSVLMQFVESKEEPKAVTVGAKVVQAGKDVSYVAVILGGFAVAGFLLWSVGSEFFMSDSPSAIFTKALKRVKADPRVIEALGEPITGHGEMSGRGRRRHIAHQEYIVEGESYMRVKFYVDGSKRKGEAHLDLKKS
ncbi:mitochondrial import inner membrane translocase subunit Tim21-like isoform X3 [Halichondria panicea]|uniref:mitochondrial import inner membrane translocase subunit Tim21-like isoform X3 n=1 Tax=Halichondria panicea TaxID=6063 RepID=UPI00312B4A30